MLPLSALLALALSAASFQQDPPAPPAQPADSASVEVAVEAAATAATEVAEDVAGMRVRPIVSVGSLYSGTRGFGVGGGVAISNLARRGDRVQIEARVAQRVLGAFGAYQTGEVERTALFGLVGGSAVTSSRFPFAGTGPHADPEGRLFLDRSEAEAEARVAWQPWGVGGPLVQPFARFRVDRLRGFAEADSGGLARVSQADLAALGALVGETRAGVSVGLGLLSDSRDNEGRPRRGAYVQASASRFTSTDGSGLRFTRAEGTGYLFRPAPFKLPLQPERGALFVRVAAIVVREDGGGGLPPIYLPVLDRDLLVGWPSRDFAGRDGLSLGVGARGVLLRNLMAFRVEGTLLGMIGAAYDDVFREFTPRVSTAPRPIAAGENVPLQPSVGFGINLHLRDRERPLVGALIGIGPGGLTTTSFRIVVGLDRYLPELR